MINIMWKCNVNYVTLISPYHLKNNLLMSNNNYPVPPSHRTFQFGKVTIDSNFDSANCSYAERVNPTTYAIWLAPDHPKNNYRVWFYFSISGVPKGSVMHFQIKNMQNQSKLIEEGLTPVYRQQNSKNWKRVSHSVNLTDMILTDNQMQWIFTHQFASSQKHYFAFCAPWSNLENSVFLDDITLKTASLQDIYFHRGVVTSSLEGRPVQLLTISSRKGLTQREQTFDDPLLFVNSSKPRVFQGDKKCIIIGARVHPGQVPGSHVMCGIIDELTESSRLAAALRDNFIFYIMPIFNPDGVARGHFRVDVNGINLNRCYINPSPKQHSSIYAIKKIIMHCHVQQKYFAFLDLHAQASRRGNFVYGNSLNELNKQVQACLFPRILSLNSQNFEYQGSNFMQKHMYVKQKGDHISKEGCGRVAMYHATKNPNSWTVECSYNNGQKFNVLQPKKQVEDEMIVSNQDNLDYNLINNYKMFAYQEAKEFYDVGVYRKLGKEILQSLLDLIQSNPTSRITNPQNYFKNIANIRLNLAMALVKMAPNRFEPHFRKIYYMLEGTDNDKIIKRCFRALYFYIVKKAKIPNLVQYLKEQDNTVLYPAQKLTSRQMSRRKTFTNSLKTSQKSTSPSIRPIRRPMLVEQNYCVQKQQASSVMITSQDSPDKSGISFAGFAALLNTKKNNPVVNVVEIDKQIYLKNMGRMGKTVKDEFRMLAVCNLQGRYQSQHQITNFSNYKKKSNNRGDDQSMRKTCNEVFRLQILPKLMTGNKQIISISPALKHHDSLK